MKLHSYYKDHWVNIETERLDRYEVMFKWSPAFERLLEPANIQAGQIIGDLGCGPGHLTVELLRRTGKGGHVHAFDINIDFLKSTELKAKALGLADRLTIHHLKSDLLPIDDDALDCIVAKNVLVYVDNPAATLQEFLRTLKCGGKAHIIDSDFSMVAIDPIPTGDWRALLDAASHAFRTPNIGRKLYGLALSAGFSKVDIQVITTPDTKGRLLNFAQNIGEYARQAGTIEESTIQQILDTATNAIENGTYFGVNPQFVVTATR